jgi:simple sugar transport system permease protein
VGGDLYRVAWQGTFGTPIGFGNVLLSAIPLILTGLAVSLAYRMGLWNVGIDGQILMGAWLALFIAFKLDDTSGFAVVPIMFLAGAVGGAVWMLIPAIARVYLQTNEIVTTFLLNFGALAWMSYWIRGDWFDQAAGGGGTRSRPIPEQTQLGLLNLDGVVIHWGLLLAIGLPLLAWVLLATTRCGFELTVAGASERHGRYAGIRVERKMLGVLLLSGAIGGFAGVVDMLGNTHYYGDALAGNIGFAALVVAVLAGGSPLGVILVGFLYSVMFVGGDSMSVAGVPTEAVLTLIGLILMLATAAEAISRLRFVRSRPSAVAAAHVPIRAQEEGA